MMRIFGRTRRFGGSKGFTLMEVNLAIFIMAVGVLSMVSLYPLGYRESQQARDDVVAAAMADTVLNGLSAALSCTNIPWNAWENFARGRMNKGWDDYCTDAKGWRPKSSRAISDTADALIRSVCGLYDGPGSPLSDIQETMGRLKNAAGGDNAIAYALVVTPGWTSIGQKDNISGTALQRNDFSRLVLSFRATRHAPMLFSQPIFSTEVRFQGQRRQ